VQIRHQIKNPRGSVLKPRLALSGNTASVNKNIFSLVLHYSQFNYYITLF